MIGILANALGIRMEKRIAVFSIGSRYFRVLRPIV